MSTVWGIKQSFVLRKIQAEQLSGLEVEISIFAIHIHRAAEFLLFFPPWQPEAENILQDY